MLPGTGEADAWIWANNMAIPPVFTPHDNIPLTGATHSLPYVSLFLIIFSLFRHTFSHRNIIVSIPAQLGMEHDLSSASHWRQGS